LINHARTLLLNRAGDARPIPSFFGEEYVPSTFGPVDLPAELLTARSALLGSNPDDAGLNYMLWQYVRILHSTEFEDYVYNLDTRVTYLHTKTLVDFAFGPAVDNNEDALQFTGLPALGGSDGRLQESWRIEQLTQTSYRLTNMRTGAVSTETVAVTDGVTDFMPIPGHSSYQVRVFVGVVDTGTWYVTYTAKPLETLDPTARAGQLNNTGSAVKTTLFPAREPFVTFLKLWEKESRFAYKMSGALLALVYRTEELRLGS
jgi:hypothetical protein